MTYSRFKKKDEHTIMPLSSWDVGVGLFRMILVGYMCVVILSCFQ